MDAPTTTPADNNGSGGDRGWFTPTPSRKQSAPEGGDQEQGEDRIPSRPVSAIRPVGTPGTDRRPEPAPHTAQGAYPGRQRADEHQRTSDGEPGQNGAEPGRNGGPVPGEPPHSSYFATPPPYPVPQGPTHDGPRPAETAPASSFYGPRPGSGPVPGQNGAGPAGAGPAESRRNDSAQPDNRSGGFSFFGGSSAPQAPAQAAPQAPVPPQAPAPQSVPQPAPGPGPGSDRPTAPPADAGRDRTGTPDAGTPSAGTPATGTAVPPTATPGPGTNAAAVADSTVADTAGARATADTDSGSPSPDAILIRRTMAEIDPVADKVTSYFYAMLFVRHPDLRELFPAAMDTQRDRLFRALLTAAEHVDDAGTLTEYLVGLGRGHRKYGTQPEHYPAVGECLLLALGRYATKSWDAETEAAWVRAYTAISQIMIDAAAVDERTAPAWWDAEVVSHDLRTSDIAVITVRPSQPYAFRAGQYTTLETPWWPRVWRHFSFSSAPRPDGLLSFHIRAVPAGWVSNALVHRARPGDVIRLGPPVGSMTVDHNNDNGLLCLGGGTGIAPIKALVEDVAEHGRKRAVDVFYGARSDHDLYDIDTMQRLEQTHPWLRVRPVVADGRAPAGVLSGPLPEVVRQFGPWDTYDAYLSGPAGMVRNGIDTLVGIGIPPHRIRHDSIEELVASAPGQGA
ncbi:globin domain-containing protein [Streptomyces sp. NPDC048639]|uniref:globin domain-containing protein n=1 Tax=Streptomyces sp. NPDC048639 TaxID=3365581 RepID=UPI003720A389